MKISKFLIIFIVILTVFSYPLTNKAFALQTDKNVLNSDDYQYIKVGTTNRMYLVHTPHQYDPNVPMPLVIVLHGTGQNPKAIEKVTEMSQKADKEGFIAVYPAGSTYVPFTKHFLTWRNSSIFKDADNQDELFMKILFYIIQNDYNIDPKRIYVCGFSSGAAMTYHISYDLADKIAAFGIVSGFFNPRHLEPINPLPVVIFHGTLDTYVPYLGGVPKQLFDKLERSFDAPVLRSVRFWIKNNNCTKTPITIHHDEVIKETFQSSDNNSDVVLYTLINQGHAWPGGKKAHFLDDIPTSNLSATDVLWEFFASHPKK